MTATGPELAKGSYVVAWSSFSSVDGHRLDGSISFGIGVVPSAMVFCAAVAAALWAAIGVGVGTVVRNQVPALVGIVVWLLFVENLLVGDIANVASVGRFLPGAAGKTLTGQDPSTLLSPGVGLILLVVYAAGAAAAARTAIVRRDV